MTAIRRGVLTALPFLAVGTLVPLAAHAGASLRLTTENGCQGELVCQIPWVPGGSFVDFTRDDRCGNDRARSVLLNHVPPGTRIEFLGSASGRGERGRTVITVLRPGEICVPSFDQPFMSDELRVETGERPLDGKVSAIRILPE